MEHEDGLKVKEQVEVQVSVAVGPARYSKVIVESEDGIFKNGTHYSKGDEAIIEANAAARLEAIGDVTVLGAVEAPKGDE